jgi:predicted RNase H-like nuclease (RuvC/YqgF family)
MVNEHRDVRIITSAVNNKDKDIEKLRRENRNLLQALMNKDDENSRLEGIVAEYEQRLNG